MAKYDAIGLVNGHRPVQRTRQEGEIPRHYYECKRCGREETEKTLFHFYSCNGGRLDG